MQCGFPECMWNLCQKCAMDIAAGEAGKLPELHIQWNRQSLGLLACAQIHFMVKLVAVFCICGREEECGPSFGPQTEKWAFLLLSWFLERATLDIYPFCMSTSFYCLRIKSTVLSLFVWSKLYCQSQNLQKLIVNVFTNKNTFHRRKGI